MFAMYRARRCLLSTISFFLLITSSAAFAGRPAPALSPLATDLGELVIQGQSVDDQVSGISLTPQNSCTELGLASTSMADWLAAMEAVYAGLTSTFSVDVESLDALDQLSSLNLGIATNVQTLSRDLNTIASAAELVEVEASLAAMLSLSSDIGSMADRIGEMADRILVMADNIGLMADRILITQQLQSSNVVTTQNSILATQLNAVALSDSISTITYEPALAGLLTQANALDFSMGLVSLNQLNMATELARIQAEAGIYLAELNTLYTAVMMDSAIASQYTNGDTLTLAGDLSVVHRALALSLQDYADRINALAPTTSSSILGSATDSMLQLTMDIGIMSERIVEMIDRIVVMADNIGDMSTRIIETQNLQQTNLEFTQASLSSASSTTINVITANGL